MCQWLGYCEDSANRFNILFTTHKTPNRSKIKCIVMVGDKKPAPLVLCGGDQDLPWVESASHLGHMLHKSVTIDHNTSVARATFIDQSIETCQAFNFASPVELFRALQVFCCSHYGSMLRNIQDGSAKQYFRS